MTSSDCIFCPTDWRKAAILKFKKLINFLLTDKSINRLTEKPQWQESIWGPEPQAIMSHLGFLDPAAELKVK